MASHRPYERLLKQVQRLPQRDEYWAGITRLARMWVMPKKAPPYRPYMTLWLSQDGKIVASTAHPYPPSADEVMTAMETDLGAYEPLPGLVSIPAVTPEQLGHLYYRAAQFYQASPWAWLHDHHPFAITCPPEDSPRYAIVMGSGGEVFGLAVYDRLADLRAMFTPPGRPRQRAKRCTWSVLFFEAAPAVSFEDLDAMAANDWPVAAPQAYPVFGRASSEEDFALPSRADLLWMEGALGALVAYMDAHMKSDQGVVEPADLILSVPRVDGETQVHLRLLEFEAIFR